MRNARWLLVSMLVTALLAGCGGPAGVSGPAGSGGGTAVSSTAPSSGGGGGGPRVQGPSASPNLQWTRQFGHPNGYDRALGADGDSAGNAYVAGYFSFSTAFVRKYDGAGNVLWTQTTPSSSAFDVRVSGDHVYMVGNSAGNGLFVQMDPATGSAIWSQQVSASGSSAGVYPLEGAADGRGGLFAAGIVNGTLPGQTQSGHYSNGFALHLDANGNLQWARQFGAGNYSVTQSLGCHWDGNALYVCGGIENDPVSPSNVAFLRKYDAQGNLLWAQTYPQLSVLQWWNNPTQVIEWTDVGTTPSGRLFVLGIATWGQPSVAEIDPATGSLLWSKTIPTSYFWDNFFGMSVDDTGLYLIGSYYAGRDPNTQLNIYGGRVEKVDLQGNPIWTETLNTTYTVPGHDSYFFTDPYDHPGLAAGRLYVPGFTNGTLPGQTKTGNWDAFLLAYQVVADATPPVTTASLSGTAGSHGWYTSPVTVTLSATDPDDSVASTTYSLDGGTRQTYSAPFTVSGDGTHTLTFSSTDSHGNAETAQTITIKVDTTPPTVTAAPSASVLWPPNHSDQDVTISGKVSDLVSGVDASSGQYTMSDSEGALSSSGTFSIGSDGSYSFTVVLEASRLGTDRGGRTYTITVGAKNLAGLTGSASAVVAVPHDQGH